MMNIDKQKLWKILDEHSLQLKDKTKGGRANLDGANLLDADLNGTIF